MIQRTIPNPYQSLYRTLIVTAFLMNIPAVVLMMSGNRTLTMLLGLTQFVMFFAGVLFLITGKQQVRNILHLLNGTVLVEWSYDTFHWTRFVETTFLRQRKNALFSMIAVLLGGPGFALLGISAMTLNDGMVLGTILALCSYGIMTFYARSVKRRSERPPFEAFIAESGAFINGVFIDWSAAGTTLHTVSIINDTETNLRGLRIQYSVRSWNGRLRSEITAPIPNGKDHEAAAVISALSSKVSR